MNRRQFLMSAAAALPAGKIRAAMYGTRHSHARGKLKAILDSPHYDFAGIYESAAKPKDIVGHRWLSEEEILGDKNIQMISVETPVWELMAAARKVIAAGKHLHLEKPPTHEWAPFQELIAEARRKKLLVQLGYIWRFHDGIRRALEAAREGWLGQVYMLRGAIHTDLGASSREPLSRYKGGMMFELGCHQIDRMVDLLGRPKAVKSWLQHVGSDKLADNTVAVFEYDKALAVITTSARLAGSSQHRTFEILGTDGAVILQPVEPGTRMRISMRDARGPYKSGWQEIELAPQVRYQGDFLDFARALKTGTPLTYSYDFELLVQETLLRASQEL